MVDLAVIRAPIKPTKLDLFSEKTLIPFDKVHSSSSIRYLGFPLGLVPADGLTPIVKKACVARIIKKETNFEIGGNCFQRFLPKII